MKTPEQWQEAHTTLIDGEDRAIMHQWIAAIQSDARQDLAEQVTKLEAQLRPTLELLLGATCRLGFCNPETPEGKDLWALRSKLHEKAKQIEALLDSLDQREGKGRKI